MLTRSGPGCDFVCRGLARVVVIGRRLRVPFLGEIGPGIVLGLVLTGIGSIGNTVEKIMQIYLMRTFQRTSFFKSTVATLFHDRTS